METEAILCTEVRRQHFPGPRLLSTQLAGLLEIKFQKCCASDPSTQLRLEGIQVVQSVRDKTHSISNKGMHKDIMTNLYFAHTKQAHATHTHMHKHS